MIETPSRTSTVDLAIADRASARSIAGSTGRVARLLGWGIALLLAVHFLETIGFVLLLALGAAAIAALLAPVARRLPWSRNVSGPLVGVAFLVLVVGLVVLLGWLLQDRISGYAEQWPQVRQQIDQQLQSWLSRLGIDAEISMLEIQRNAVSWVAGGGGQMLSSVASAVGAAAVGFVLLVFGFIFLLTSDADAVQRGIERVSPRHRDAIRGSIDDLELRLRHWGLGVLVSMLVIGTLCAIAFSSIGLPLALPLAALAGLSEVVPTLGPTAVFAATLLVGATQGGSTVMWVAVTYLVIQALESNVVYPLVMKNAVRVPALVSIFSVVLWGRVFGPLGFLLAIPIDLTIWTLLDHFYMRRRDGDPARAAAVRA